MSLLRRSGNKTRASRRSPTGSGHHGEPMFKPRTEEADAHGMIPGLRSAPDGAQDGLSAPGWQSALELANLGHDDSIEGLTLDQVSVVRIGDRSVVVPVPLDLAEKSGFEMVATSDESLFAIGVRPVPQASVPLAAFPGSAESAMRWDDPVAAARREPEVAVASAPVSDLGHGAAGDDVDGFMADLPEPHGFFEFAERPAHADPLNDPNDPGEFTESPHAAPAPGTTDARYDKEHDEPSATVEPARPEDVHGPDRYEWPVDAVSAGWPLIERRLNDRRATPTRPWGEGGSPLPQTEEPPSSDAAHPVASDVVLIAPDTPVTASGEPVAALADVALRGSPQQRVTLRIQPGEVVVVTGAGGSGKSSLLRVLAGIDAPATGSVTVDATPLESLTEDDRIVREAVSPGFVAASGHLVPDLSVIENIELPLLVGGSDPAVARTAAEALLDRWRIGSLGARPAGTLSTTEQRCVVLARALISDRPLILADDPTIGIAADVAADVVGLLLEQARLGAAVVIATSDPRVAVAGVRLLRMHGGQIIEDTEVPVERWR